jgi:hypothetical protein
MKYEWKKHEKELYGAKDKASSILVPNQNFIMIDGKGDPNKEDFAERVGVLYSVAYAIKMRYKKEYANLKQSQNLDYDDFTVFPLEGVWTSDNPENPLDKNSFVYTIMIKQPDFITKEMYDEAYKEVSKKKPNILLKEVRFKAIEEHKCVQILHLGSFDDEPKSFDKMNEYTNENKLERIDHYHREIYLSDARKTEPEKRRTILRYKVKNVSEV